MLANAWAFEALRYAGAAYLLFLAFKSARAALTAGAPALRHVATSTLRSAYRRGLVLHLTNPKAILFFGSLYAVGRSEEHTSELQSLMRISYAVFCLKKKKKPSATAS